MPRTRYIAEMAPAPTPRCLRVAPRLDPARRTIWSCRSRSHSRRTVRTVPPGSRQLEAMSLADWERGAVIRDRPETMDQVRPLPDRPRNSPTASRSRRLLAGEPTGAAYSRASQRMTGTATRNESAIEVRRGCGPMTSSSASRRPNVRSFCLSSSASGWSDREARRHALELLARDLAEGRHEPRLVDQAADGLRVVGDRGAEGRELGRRRVPHPAADVDLARRQVEVAAAGCRSRRTRAGRPRRRLPPTGTTPRRWSCTGTCPWRSGRRGRSGTAIGSGRPRAGSSRRGTASSSATQSAASGSFSSRS